MLTSWISHLIGRPLRADEEVMFFPRTARFTSATTVELQVDAWVYENQRRPGVTALFRRYLRIDPASLTPAEHEEFRRRVRLFLTDSEGGKLVPITISTPLCAEPRSLGLPVTPPSGRTSARLTIPAPSAVSTPWIHFEARGPAKTFPGRALVVPAEGISIVSDIDDTIKHTQVGDRRDMLLNTFARPLAAVPGMARFYQQFHARDEAGVRFHYVSSSPHQLWPMIEEFLERSGFPSGTVHMRSLDWRVEAFGEGPGSAGHKLTTIAGLMREFPARRFVLVGDSGERDPEVYGQLARDFPGQVAAIHIRNITGLDRQDTRLAQAFRGVAAETWTLFAEASELAHVASA